MKIKCPRCETINSVSNLNIEMFAFKCIKCQETISLSGANEKNIVVSVVLNPVHTVKFNYDWINDESKMALMPFQNLEEIKLADQMHSIDNIFERLKAKFKEEYCFDAKDIELVSNKTRNAIKAYYNKKESKIYFDVTTVDILHVLFITILTWINNYEENKLFGSFFNYVTTIFYALIKHKTICNVYSLKYIKREFLRQTVALNIAVECQYFAMYFCLAHELAHAYIASLDRKFQSRDEEYEADKIAYDVVLKLMIEEEQSLINVEDRELLNYCYLVPMMFFDFMDIYYRMQLIITGEKVSTKESPSVIKRKDALFKIPQDEQYQFDTQKGNILYNDFLNVIDYFKSTLKYKESDGSLYELFKLIEKIEG